MSERRIAEKKISAAIAELRGRAVNQDAGGELEAYDKGVLNTVFELENLLEMAHPEKFGKPFTFEVRRELFLPGRFIKSIYSKDGVDIGRIGKEYQNGDVKLLANNDQLDQLKKKALEAVDAGNDVDRGIKTAARAVIKQLEKAA